MKNYDKEIEELETKIKILKEKKEFDFLLPRQKLAELIHERTCTLNHTDGCSWHYEKWDGFNNPTRQRYVDKANKILQKVKYLDAIEVLKNI